MDSAVSKLPEKQQTLQEMREKVKLFMAYRRLMNEQIGLEKDVQTTKQASEQVKATYVNAEKSWLNNQATVLANHLHDGEACPVCGSVDHPNKAIITKESITKEQLEILKRDYDEKDSLYRNAVAGLKNKQLQREEKEQELLAMNISLTDTNKVEEELVASGKRLDKEVEHLKKQREQLQQLKASLEKVTIEIKQLEPKREKMEITYQELRTDYQAKKAVYDDRLDKIPKELRVLAELEKRIMENQTLKLAMQKAWEEAQTTLQRVREEQARAETNQAHAVSQLQEATQKREKSEKEFSEALLQARFESEEAYNQAKVPMANQQQWKEEINQFNQHLSTLNQQVKDLKDSLTHKTRADLTILQEELTQLKLTYERALHQLNVSRENELEAIKLKENIMETESKVKEHEKQLGTITDLYDVMRGQNGQKISFERYLQIEYLEQIIDAANGRLNRLSNGQFYLIRSDRQEAHGRQSGLALDVYDSYTGQARDVKTLSGGEKFNASLSLALGMSDMIQSFQGNISIDTMFIDEGFGSLDEESLTKAIDTLIDLQQSGRMIGVISHVQELKTMFPATLEVKKTKEGYSRTEFVIK